MSADQESIHSRTISVIIPTHNRSALLAEAIASVLAQTVQVLEIIVIDDGSTDDTETVIASFSAMQVRSYRHTQSKGPSACRNVGIDLARGSLIAFLDDDDSWLPEKLEKQIKWIDLSGLAANDFLCFTHIISCFPDREEPATLLPYSNEETVGEYLYIKSGVLLTSSLLLPKSLAIHLRFDETLRNHEDWLFFLQAESRHVKVAVVPEYLVRLRRSDNHTGLSSILTSDMAREWISRISSLVTERAKHAYAGNVLAKRLIVEGRYREGLKVAATAWIKRGIRLRRFISLVLRAFSPRLQSIIKNVANIKL